MGPMRIHLAIAGAVVVSFALGVLWGQPEPRVLTANECLERGTLAMSTPECRAALGFRQP
jgi:hypothetical protein